MSISSRQRMVLDILLSKEQGLTIKEIAEEVEVSTRTVHRELDEIEQLLDSYQLKLRKRAGVGVQIEGNPVKKEELRVSLINLTTLDFTAEERKVLILCFLLDATEPVKLVSLAYDLKVTPATISHDLDELEGWIGRYDLTLIRRRGYGIELQGSESAKRKAMSSLISDNLNEYELIGLIKENIQGKSARNIDSVSEHLLGLIEKEKLIKVENALRNLENELPYPLADSAYIGLVIHLSLAMERIQKGERISFDEDYLAELKNTLEYKYAFYILERLRNIFQVDIPDAEVGYITMHLRGAKQRTTQDDPLLSGNAGLMAKVHKLIQYCEEQLHVQFGKDSSLLHGLLTHIEPAIFRIKKSMKIRNPLLDEIKKNYPELFAVIREGVSRVFPYLDVPDEEIGYLVMHFGASLERSAQKGEDYRALVVCSSGIGSSKILATRIEREIPEIMYLKNISLFDIEKIPRGDYDIIISTIPLSSNNNYILVSPLLTKGDIQKIKHSLRNIRVLRPREGQLFAGVHIQEPIAKLRSLQSYCHHIVDILEGFEFQTIFNPYATSEGILNHICQNLSQKQIIRDKENVVNQLLERERLSGIGIPNTGMALFHGRNEQITRVSFTIHFLTKPIWLKSMDNEEIEVDNILMLLGPIDINKEGLEVLSQISALLIDESTVDMLRSKDANRMFRFFSEKLYEFCCNQMQ